MAVLRTRRPAGLDAPITAGDGTTTRVDLRPCGAIGAGAAAIEFPSPMYVTADGDIYLGTEGRGVIMLEAGK